MKMQKVIFLLASSIASLAAHAEIIDLGSITRDTNTGLEWLDVTETVNLSYNQVTAQMGSGGTYEGWRYATAAEFDQLVSSFGYSAVKKNCQYGVGYCDTLLSGDNQSIENFIRTLGDTLNLFYDSNNTAYDVSSNGAGYTFGILGTSFSGSNITRASVADFEAVYRATQAPYSDSPDSVQTAYDVTRNKDYASKIDGSFLVRPSAVPVPAAAWLFGSGLLGLAGLSRKRAAHA